MYAEKQTNQAIIYEIIHKNGTLGHHFLKKYNLIGLNGLIFDAREKSDLYLKILPYVEFETLYFFYRDIINFIPLYDDINFQKIFSQILITNKDLLRNSDPETSIFYKLAQERLDKPHLNKLEQFVFNSYLQKNYSFENETDMKVVSYELNLACFHKKMSLNMLLTNGSKPINFFYLVIN